MKNTFLCFPVSCKSTIWLCCTNFLCYMSHFEFVVRCNQSYPVAVLSFLVTVAMLVTVLVLMFVLFLVLFLVLVSMSVSMSMSVPVPLAGSLALTTTRTRSVPMSVSSMWPMVLRRTGWWDSPWRITLWRVTPLWRVSPLWRVTPLRRATPLRRIVRVTRWA